MKTKTTRIQKIRQKFLKNESLILQKAGISQEDYNNMILETGCRFLERLYPGTKFERYYRKFAYNTQFWNWFKAEYKDFENLYVSYLHENKVIPTKQSWHNVTMSIVNDSVIESSFYDNFLKNIYNGTV